jgi:hypothetical protein
MTIAPASIATPDWDAIERDVKCPLCDYNLRGLVEPRCPECGYAFGWKELLDDQLIDHPYLFEHYPRRNLWSFRRTLAAGFKPRKFWTTLLPTHRVVMWRLVTYFLIAAALTLVLGLSSTWTATVVNIARRNLEQRAIMHRAFARGIDPYSGRKMTTSMLQMRLTAFPTPWDSAFWRDIYQWGWLMHRWATKLTFVAMAWPLLTFGTLMIFIRSMQRAKIRLVHILRCCIYCGDVFIWVGVMVCLIKLLGITGPRDERVGPLVFLAFVILMAARMATAFRRYLLLRHATATVILTQIVVTLAVMTALAFDRDFYYFIL